MTNEDKLAEGVVTLQKYKNSAGHKALVEIAYQEMNAHLAKFMYGEDIDLIQTRADFRAWMEIVASVDKRIVSYEMQLKQVLEGTEQQMQAMQRGSQNGRF